MPAVQKGGNSSLSKPTANLRDAAQARPFSYKKRSHLRKADEISSVFDFKCRVSAPHFVALGKPNGLAFPRLGIMVAKKTARLSVSRNYMRRIVREQFRAQQNDLAPLDIVVRVTKSFNRQDFASIMQELSVIFVKMRKCQNS
ncbi:MAG: ribonuclease P protein component [Hydrogenophilales bacterium]|nr:ribonuclease P protein component [Hydrogenophilales bacterium]